MKSFHQIFLYASSAFSLVAAQVPTLEPAQTVNVATGEMGFNLQIGVVKGVNGADFPIGLGYQAGIHYFQPASPAGLGFSYGAGAIARRVVFVPDDNNASSSYYENQYVDTNIPAWLEILNFFIMIISFALNVFVPGAGIAISAIYGSVMGLVVAFTPRDFVGGGIHTPRYEYAIGSGSSKTITGGGLGFFHQTGSHDVPDIYFVSTPYVSGELVWQREGTGSEAGIHFFTFKQNFGSVSPTKPTAIAKYNKNTYQFEITLADGTRLLFEKCDRENNFSRIEGSRDPPGIGWADYSMKREQRQSVSTAWWLTKVLFSDYADGSLPADSDPLNSESTNRGAWICFNYDEYVGYEIASPTGPKQADKYSLQVTEIGYANRCVPSSNAGQRCRGSAEGIESRKIVHNYLKEVVTPNQKAIFAYSGPAEEGRLDDVWYSYTCNQIQDYPPLDVCGANSVQWKRPHLKHIEIRTKENMIIRLVSFVTDYSLRPNSFNSIAPNGGCLTLKSIEIQDSEGKRLPPITFEYVTNNPDGWNSVYRGYPPSVREEDRNSYLFWVEQRDLWGYYSQNASTVNHFNEEGSILRASGADAWSLRAIHLPMGNSIEWEYEPNRYDMANGVQTKNAAGQAIVKYGGGVRVKRMTVRDGTANGAPLVRSFFYTDVPHNFDESAAGATTSGHATIEPFPYYVVQSESDDVTRQVQARGGLYTAAKVTYEMVQVVDNYSSVSPHAPNGYTVYEFFTSKEFPNKGRYGEHDASWCRGMLKSATVYDRNNTSVSRKDMRYKRVPYHSEIAGLNNIYGMRHGGWIYADSVLEERSRVKTLKQFCYAPEIGDGPDFVAENNVILDYLQVRDNFIIGDEAREVRSKINHVYASQFGYQSEFGDPRDDAIVIRSHVRRLPPPNVSQIPTLYEGRIMIGILKDLVWKNESSYPETQTTTILSSRHLSWSPSITSAFDVSRAGICKSLGDVNKMDLYIEVKYGWNDTTETYVHTGYFVFNDIEIGSNGALVVGGESGTPPDSAQWVEPAVGIHGYYDYDELIADYILIRKGTRLGDFDGQPNQMIMTNSNGSMHVTIPTPAYWKYPLMGDPAVTGNRHMLTQACQTAVYNIANTTAIPISPTAEGARVVSATVTRWDQLEGRPLPIANYAWRVQMNSNGLPIQGFTEFDHAANSNPGWLLGDGRIPILWPLFVNI